MTENIKQKPDNTGIGVRELLEARGANIGDYAACIVTGSVHDQPRTTYIGRGQPKAEPGLIPPKLLQDLGMPVFLCEEHRAETGIQVTLGIDTNEMKKIGYFVIPGGKEFGAEDIKNVLEKYAKKQLDYRLVKYNEPLPYILDGKRFKPRQAIVFDDKLFYEDELANRKNIIYESIKNGKPIAKSELLAGKTRLVAELDDVFKVAEKGPSSTTPSSVEEYAQKNVEIGNTYLVEELKIPIKQEYVSAINRLLNGAGQLAYKLDLSDSRKVMFFIGAKPNEYIDPQSGKEKRELAIKGILDMQTTLEMSALGQFLEDKSIEEKG